jgi:hypothetical protein
MTATALVRIGLPAAIALAGVVALVAGSTPLGLVLLGTGGTVAIANWYVRLSIGSQDDRAGEDAARRQFDKTGRWPGE